MMKPKQLLYSAPRVLVALAASAVILSGCVSQTVAGAASGGGSGAAVSTRQLAFVDAPSYNIGTVAAGSTTLVRLSISTTGTGDATITSSSNSDSNFTFNGGTFPGSGGTCAQPISGNCSIAILFTAPVSVGIFTDTVSIGYDNGSGATGVSLTLSASVTAAAVLTVNGGAPYAFGNKNVGTSTDATLTVANAGGLLASALSLSGLSAPLTFKGGSYPGTGGTCAITLASGASCTVVVTYAPTSAGSTNQTLIASYNNGSGTTSTSIAITGTGQTLASLSFSAPAANPYDYGNVTIGAPGVDLTVTLSNAGGQSATAISASGLSAPITYKGGSYPGTGGTCGATLAAASTCNLIVTYTPTAAVTTNVTLSVTYADGSGATPSITKGLRGTGLTPAALAISDGATYDYTTHPIGSTTSKTFTVTNSGGSTATALSGSALAAPYSYAGGTYPGTAGTCAASLAAAGTCTVVVNYAPTAAVVSNATLTLPYNSGASVTSATRPITGTGAAVATLSLNAGANYGYGSVSIGSSNDATLTVANSGGVPATALAFSGLSAPVTFKGGTFPGTGGTCGATLAGGASCTVVVNYTPLVAGATSQTLLINYNNGNIGTSTSQLVTGTALTLASVSITAPASNPYAYGNDTIGNPVDVTVTLSNSGGQAATGIIGTGLGAPINYKGGTYPGTGGTCGASLAAAATCNIIVTYTPTAAVLSSVTLTVTYADGSGATPNVTRTFNGTGITPAVLSVSDGATYDYTTHAIGSTTSKTFTVTNSGGSTAVTIAGAAFAAPYAYAGGTFPGTAGTCGATLAAAGTCTIVVNYSPTAAVVSNASLTVNYNDGAAAQSALRPVTGTGASVATLSLNAGANYGFGSKNVTSSTNATLTVANSGTTGATALAFSGLSAPLTFAGGSFPGTGGTCGATLAGSSSCTVVVTYAPTIAGATSQTLLINYNNGVSGTSTSQLVTGTAVALASIAITTPVADPFDYTDVTIGAPGVDQTFTLSNTGGQSATSLTATGLAAPFNFKGGAYPGTGGTCGASLAAAGTCTIIATYLPTTPGVDSDSIAIAYDDGSGSTINLSHGVTGTGVNAANLTFTDSPSYDFGSRTVSTTTYHTFTISNSGGATATSIAATALSAPFSFKGGTYPGTGGSCGTSLGGGATCTIIGAFAPTGTGAFTGNLILTYNDGINAGGTSSLPIGGTGGTVANLSISDGATYNYGSIVVGYTVTKTFTITNVGGVAATAMAGAALSAPYSYLGGAYPGTGGTCGATLGAAGTCTVLVKYSPTSAVVSNSTFQMNYNDSSIATNSQRAITGSGATITKIAGGTGHTCALYSTGAVKCWGAGSFGQLGNGGTSASSTPVAVAGITSATDLAVGANHSCAMLSNGRVYCWGADNSGQLGDNATLANQSSPAQVGLYTDFTKISAGGDSTCGLRSGGTIVCWGNDLEGTLGDNAGFVNQATPVTVSGLTTMTDVSVGRAHACGRKSDNTFRCWGSNVTYGQLGNGTTTTSGVPVTPAPGTATASAAGGDVSCSFISGGSIKCWGADDMGQLGDNAALASKTTPTAIAGLANVTSIKMGLKHGCALTNTNSILCWGNDASGQLGDNAASSNQPTPVAVTGLASVSAIGVGENHSCGILSSGLVYCWGQGTAGQLGDGGSTNQPTPVLVQGL
jgi:alpha-tubulin suppressor-like RCC1 family protein